MLHTAIVVAHHGDFPHAQFVDAHQQTAHSAAEGVHDGRTRIFNNLDYNQLKNSSIKFRHFFTNLIWLYNFPIRNESKLRKTKVEEIQFFLDTQDISFIESKIPKEGILSYGNLYHSKYFDINFIYFFVKNYKQTNKNYN